MKIKAVLFFFALILTLSVPLYADSRGQKEKDHAEWRKMPPKVQKTVAEHMADGRVFEVKKEKIVLADENKKKKTTIYLVGIKKLDGKELWVIADKDGTVLDIEHIDDVREVEEDVDNERKERRKR